MKNLAYIIILIVALTVATSCTQNNGYIGPLFGQWRLEKLTSDTIEEKCDTVFFAFQSDVFQIRAVDYTSYVSMPYTGLYRRPNNDIQLNIYSHWGRDIKTSNDTINTLKSLVPLHITELSPLFEVEYLDNKKMVLEYNDYQYHFVKLN